MSSDATHAAEALGQAVDLQQRLSHGDLLGSKPSMPPRANSTTSNSIGPRISADPCGSYVR